MAFQPPPIKLPPNERGRMIYVILACLSFISFCYVSVTYSARQLESSAGFHVEDIPPALIGIAAPIQSIPDGRGNFRSGSLTATEIRQALATGRIKYVLRLNGDGENDQGHLSCTEERAIVESAGAKYVTSPSTPDRFDGHAGYRKGRGYVGALHQAADYLRRGGVLIHCRHGFDRTGAIVGGWLAANDYALELIIAHNNWNNYEKKGEAYAPYLETVVGQLENGAK